MSEFETVLRQVRERLNAAASSWLDNVTGPRIGPEDVHFAERIAVAHELTRIELRMRALAEAILGGRPLVETASAIAEGRELP